MSNRGKLNFSSKGLNVLHEGAACELGAAVSDDSGGYSETAHQSFQELDS
jgi:hypothetical protein